jgi:hypothetical protein
MAVPENLLHKEVCSCEYLKTEESIYGTISFCDLESWGKLSPCEYKVKDFCLEECHFMV